MNSGENRTWIQKMFAVSARPYIPKDVLTMTIPWKKFLTMLEDLGEIFRITLSWEKIRVGLSGNSF
jgi:hypothetical protein